VATSSTVATARWFNLYDRRSSGLIYVLGLVTLWTPIAMTDTDSLTAWHAASLVPRTVVAGLGVQQLVALPLLVGSLVFTIAFVANRLIVGDERKEALTGWSLYALSIGYCMWRIIAADHSSVALPRLLITIVSLAVLILVLGNLIRGIIELIHRRFSTARTSLQIILSLLVFLTLILLIFSMGNMLLGMSPAYTYMRNIESLLDLSLIVGAGAGTIIYWGAAVAARTLRASSPANASLWRLLRPFLIGLMAAFVAAFMLTIPSRTLLPSVEIDVRGKDTEAVYGKLLAHTDAFWHVLQQEKGRVTAIPDADVKRVWVSRAQ
jgi:hypothetical protein